MTNKGFLTPAQEQKLSEMLDGVIKLKGIPEFLDGFMIKATLALLDDTYADKLKEEVKVKLSALVDAAINEDVPQAETLASEVINELVNIPGLEEEDEALIFKGVIEISVGAIRKWIADRKATPPVLAKKKA